MGGNRTNDRSIGLRTLNLELSKQHMVYDANFRLEYLYEAMADCRNGEQCIVTRFSYVALTTRVQARKEYTTEWDSAWDI